MKTFSYHIPALPDIFKPQKVLLIRKVMLFLIENYKWKLWNQIVSKSLLLCLSSELICRDQKRHTNGGHFYQCKKHEWLFRPKLCHECMEKVTDQLYTRYFSFWVKFRLKVLARVLLNLFLKAEGIFSANDF